MEIAVAAGLLTVLLLVITQTMSAVERHIQRTDQRAHAMRSVENLMEQVTVAKWNDVNEQRLTELRVPEGILAYWPKATVEGSVADEDAPVRAKRITLILKPGGVVRDRPVTLTTWLYRAAEK